MCLSACFLFQEDGFLFDGTRLAEGAAFLARLRDDRVLCAQMGERGRAKVGTQNMFWSRYGPYTNFDYRFNP